MHLVRTLDEGVDESVGDLAENRTDDLFEHLAGKLVGELELDLAG
jgi:hypothetical protein